MNIKNTLIAGTFAAAHAIFATGAAFAQSGNFVLELNNATDLEGSCRVTYVATNNTGISLTKTAYEVAIFDGEGVVSDLLILEFGELPIAKTKVVQFDFADKECADISRIVLNNLTSCDSADGAHVECLDALLTTTRTDIDFGV